MKINENIQILGPKTVLIPYEAEHVPKYSNWMADEEIRRLTASDRLSLEEEYEMQRNWREDEDKLTFIVLDATVFGGEKKREVGAMVGDVNLFIGEGEAENGDGFAQAEIEVMIAEEAARGKGIATEAVKLIVGYAIETLKIRHFFVKITDDNTSSLHLFEKKLKFTLKSHNKIFNEYNLELEDEEERIQEFIDFFRENARISNYRVVEK
ncbi:unnamed protein product [Caenorhabditis angaria]|uniref:N-acetyltransferase domain-containing protein n=1 Tax=Caenorhabditis angaria TaxID=860376 RepID=A0A9P1IH72_9PELO|nr:unnamed protein product [Caenorhabditis angaria]